MVSESAQSNAGLGQLKTELAQNVRFPAEYDAAGSPGGTKLITTIQKPEHRPVTSCRFFLANNRRCTALSRAKAVWYHLPENTLWWKFLLGLPIIPSGSRDHKLQCRNDKQPLAAFALRHPHALQAPDHPALWLAEGDFEHEPLIAIAATSSAPITGVDAARHPFGWNDGAAVDFAPVQHHDADTRQIAHRPACARSRERHAAAPGRPLRRTLTKRIEKELAREFVQCRARSLDDDARKQSCRTAAIAPVRTRRIDNSALHSVAIGIWRIVDCRFTVARIGVGKAALVPVSAHCHGQHMLNGGAIATFLGGEIGIFKERGKQLSVVATRCRKASQQSPAAGCLL